MLDALKKITINEGLPGLYKGFVPGIWGVSHGAIQFMIYEELKSSYCYYKSQPIDTQLVRKVKYTLLQKYTQFCLFMM